MMRSLFSGVAGLKTHQTRMDVVSNNIANVNTVGFKSSRATFADMLSQTSKGASAPNSQLGGINPLQVGLGNQMASVDLITNDGSPQSTGKNTDVAISGGGMFVLKSGNSFYYTRDGAFEFDNDGNYVLPGSGFYVQGWNAVEGSLNTNSNPENIVVPAGRAMAAAATTSIDFSGNLNASSPVITNITYTAGGVSADLNSVVNSYKITAMKYSFSVEGETDVVNDTDFPSGIGNGTEVEAKINIGSQTDTLDGKISNVRLTLSGYGGGEIFISATDATKYAVANSTTGTTTYTVGGVEYPIAKISFTVTIENLDATADDTLQVGEAAMYKGLYLIGTKTESVSLSLEDESSGVSKTEELSGGSEAYSVGDFYGTESVNVDGKNVIAAILTLSDGSTQKVTSGFYEVGHSIPVTTVVTIFDSEGKTHAVEMLIDKDNLSLDKNANSNALAMDNSGKDNRWRIYLAPGEGEKGPATKFEKIESDGSRTEGYFNQSEENPEGSVSYIYFDSDGSLNTAATLGGTNFLSYSKGNGAEDTTSAVNFTGLTQYSGNSTAYPSADGNAFGVLQNISIDSSGILTGTYTNGVLRFEAQIAVAQFINQAGLTKTGTSLYQESNNSGAANIKTATDLGISITPSALEMSNVDLANEFTDMIVTQRGFQSNSKLLTTGDEMLETLINIKR